MSLRTSFKSCGEAISYWWRQGSARTLMVSAGIAAVGVYAVGDLVSGLRYDGYSYRDQAISELSAFDSPVRGLMVSAIVAHGLLRHPDKPTDSAETTEPDPDRRLVGISHCGLTMRVHRTRGRGQENDGGHASKEQADRYTALGIAIGAGIGCTVGVLIGGWAIPAGIGVGAGVGVALGAAFDERHG